MGIRARMIRSNRPTRETTASLEKGILTLKVPVSGEAKPGVMGVK
jgi:HSP20 family molecular chaperone IbpA